MDIHDYTVEAVKKYLRTVLLVDDRIFFSDSDAENSIKDTNLTGVSGIPDTTNQKKAPAENLPSPTGHADENTEQQNVVESSASFSPQQIIAGFAKLGVVCGLYPAQEDFQLADDDSLSELTTLCAHSDVCIFDWKLKSNSKMEDSPVPELLTKVVERDCENGDPKPIRFFAIYSDLDPDPVYHFLKHTLTRNLASYRIKVEGELYRLKVQGLTIYVYGKDPEHPHHVASADLANQIFQDFVAEYEGIMSAAAMRGIAEVRDNAKRILDQFPPALDFALAIHSGLTIANPTVPEDLSGLLSDEIRSILDDAAPNEDEIHELLATRIEQLPDSLFAIIASNVNVVKPGTTDAMVKEYFIKLFRKETQNSPFNETEVDCANHKVGLGFLDELQDLALSAAQSQDYTAGNLSKLFCQRTVYGNVRVLKPGTVVRDTQNGGYYLCLMPLCDSVRLSRSKVVFPFWKLAQIPHVTEETESSVDSNGHASSGTGGSHGLIISEKDGSPKLLCIKGKIKDRMSLWTFKAHKVVQFTKEGSSFIILEARPGENGTNVQPQNRGTQSIPPPKKFEWVAELKPLHAQRMAEYVSRQFSRVGLAESEWLRLQVDR